MKTPDGEDNLLVWSYQGGITRYPRGYRTATTEKIREER